MRRVTFLLAALIVFSGMGGIVMLLAGDEKSLSELIIARERAALDRWSRGDPQGFIEICADEVTYFDNMIEKRVDGLEALKTYYAPITGKVYFDRYELLNPRVQVHGDAAVLTFNFVSHTVEDDSARTSRWNCTEVYARFADEWKIIQTHWSPTQGGN